MTYSAKLTLPGERPSGFSVKSPTVGQADEALRAVLVNSSKSVFCGPLQATADTFALLAEICSAWIAVFNRDIVRLRVPISFALVSLY